MIYSILYTSGKACLAISWSSRALLLGDISSSASASICAGEERTGFGKVFFLGVVVVVDVDVDGVEDISLALSVHQVTKFIVEAPFREVSLASLVTLVRAFVVLGDPFSSVA